MLYYILCDVVCVKRVILISIALDWNSQVLGQMGGNVSTSLWQIGDAVSIMMHLLAYTSLNLDYTCLSVCSIWLILISLVAVKGVSRSYWETEYWFSGSCWWIIRLVHVLIAWTPSLIKGTIPSHILKIKKPYLTLQFIFDFMIN